MTQQLHTIKNKSSEKYFFHLQCHLHTSSSTSQGYQCGSDILVDYLHSSARCITFHNYLLYIEKSMDQNL